MPAPWTFAHVADIQVGSPRSYRFRPAWNDNWRTARRQILALRPELLLVGGDLTRDGNLPEHRYELEAAKADLDNLPFPVHVIPGNMDTGNKRAEVSARSGEDQDGDVRLNLTSEALARYESVFGPSRWTCVHRNVRFSGLCDMLLNSGLPEEDEQWRWLERVAELPRERHHVWMIHYALFIDRPDEPNWDPTDPETYHCWYFGIDLPGRRRLLDLLHASGADLLLTAHVHNRRTRRIDGLRVDCAPATCMSQFEHRWPDADPTLGFTVYTVTDDAVEPRFVPLERVSTRKGYGPGGHVRPEARDYSLAWEAPPGG
jgi:hypothetical protein